MLIRCSGGTGDGRPLELSRSMWGRDCEIWRDGQWFGGAIVKQMRAVSGGQERSGPV